ncbi:hypothetical protein [Thalassospira sp.]|nr:hypothetical protein [Thalassospira sp.]|tara:strand:+ start:680 stop:817 length:138 start_codon:yes stop_codon:yes gene_type:complete
MLEISSLVVFAGAAIASHLMHRAGLTEISKQKRGSRKEAPLFASG